jgi:predicted small secreted protein
MGNFLKGTIMKSARILLVVLALASTLTACGTVGGAVSGAGSDLNRAGEWIKSR